MRSRRVATIFPGLVALALGLYVISLPNVLFGVHSYVGTGYDDGVYLGDAVRFVHGVMPYRDFVMTQPPGIILLVSPVALLGRLIGTGDAMALARVLTVCVMACNASLTAFALRSKGVAAMAVAGGALSLFPLAVAAGHSLLLEPYLVFVCLLSVIVGFGTGEVSTRRVVAAGFLFGCAVSVKLWGIVPAAVFVLTLWPSWRRMVRGLAGLVAGFVVPSAIFFVLAPRSFVHEVVVDQLGRKDTIDVLSFPQRLAMMFGLGGTANAASRTGPAVAIAVVFCLAVLGTSWLERSRLSRLDIFTTTTAVVVIIALAQSPEFYDHYAYFPASFLALALGACIGRVRSYLHVRGWEYRRSGEEAHWLGWGATGAIAAGIAALVISHTVTYDDNYLALSFTPSAAITAAIPAGACVVTDSATYTLLAGRFDPAGTGCPAIVDPFGMFLAEDHDAPPPGKAPIPASFTSLWKKAFEQAQSVVLTVQFSDYIPWTSSLVSWFDANYKLISAQPHAYVYTRRTSSLPRAATSSDSSFSGDLAAGLAALQGHDLSVARVDFAQAASRDPKSPIGEFDLGVVYGDLGDPQRAARAYEAALDVAPRYVPALYNLAVMLTASDPERAIVLYQKIVGIQPSDADALFNLGLLLVSSGQQDLGRSDVRAAVALDPLLAKRIPPSIRLSSTG